MAHQIILTEDGSHTIFDPLLGDHYHSVHGAIGESTHIFINYGLRDISSSPISILEVGFGTGLNAWLTMLHARSAGLIVSYESWEAFPLAPEEAAMLNYADRTGMPVQEFNTLHSAPWNVWVPLDPTFTLKKVRGDIRAFESEGRFNLVYFDAFGPAFQPELWETKIFRSIFERLDPGALLVTYSAKGQVRRNLREAGFTVTKAPGPPGKREITVAIKPLQSP
jgi:tRNA U34 5-methylaminomethyl-2-thiouridine-forming methyltransferase MnmC